MSDKGKSTRMVLEEVSEDKFPELVEAIKAYLPASFNVQSMVTTHLKYSHLDKIGARVYTPNHAAYRYKMVVITPVATAPRFQSLSLFWSEKDVSEEEVTVLLRSLPEFKWDLPVLVRPVAADLEDEMNRIVFKLSEGVLVKAYPLDLLVYVHDGPLPPVPKLPAEYYLKQMDPCYAEEIHSSWAGIYLESAEGVRKFLHILPSVGVFKKRTAEIINTKSRDKTPIRAPDATKTATLKANIESPPGNCTIDGDNQTGESIHSKSCDETPVTSTDAPKTVPLAANIENPPDKCTLNGDKRTLTSTDAPKTVPLAANIQNPNGDELVSWVLLKHGTDIGMTYTKEGHRRLGLAKIATTTLAHRLRAEEQPIVVVAVKGHPGVASVDLHTKMGFHYYADQTVISYLPETEVLGHLPYIIEKDITCSL